MKLFLELLQRLRESERRRWLLKIFLGSVMQLAFDEHSGHPNGECLSLFWLGQAGFWLEGSSTRILIDPYLSDSLARKYHGQKHDHQRMVAAPIDIDVLPEIDYVLISHAHTDHFDPDTLAPILSRFPETRFVVPAACEALARERIGQEANLILVDAGDEVSLDGLRITVFPAAHETEDLDSQGRHEFLGFGIEVDGVRFYHSGDTVPFPALDEAVSSFSPNIALLPVNGRDKERRADGIPGNLTLDEAIFLARHAKVLVPHHWGMFSFNTEDPAKIDLAASENSEIQIIRPQLGKTLKIIPGCG